MSPLKPRRQGWRRRKRREQQLLNEKSNVGIFVGIREVLLQSIYIYLTLFLYVNIKHSRRINTKISVPNVGENTLNLSWKTTVDFWIAGENSLLFMWKNAYSCLHFIPFSFQTVLSYPGLFEVCADSSRECGI